MHRALYRTFRRHIRRRHVRGRSVERIRVPPPGRLRRRGWSRVCIARRSNLPFQPGVLDPHVVRGGRPVGDPGLLLLEIRHAVDAVDAVADADTDVRVHVLGPGVMVRGAVEGLLGRHRPYGQRRAAAVRAGARAAPGQAGAQQEGEELVGQGLQGHDGGHDDARVDLDHRPEGQARRAVGVVDVRAVFDAGQVPEPQDRDEADARGREGGGC